MQKRRPGTTAFLGVHSLLVVSFAALGAAAFFSACVDTSNLAGSGTPGTEGQACFANGTCNAGLTCLSKVCVSADGGGSTDGSLDTGSPDVGIDSGLDTGADADTGSPDAADGGTVVSKSCAVSGDGLTNCGGSSSESCCASPLVTGGTFSRSYDGITYTDSQYKANVADFRLDKYEVTVGRFRKFVDAVVGGWTPPAGSGKHTHLNGGLGLAAPNGGNEPGWDTAWNVNLPAVGATWDSSNYLACDATYGTWTPAAATNEKRPINCVNWYQAGAFCIWDGGFLPSEAEWNYAAAGGSEQRVYPWGATAPGANASLAVYGCYYDGVGSCTGVTNIAPVGSVTAGNGKYGQTDLAGNIWEWALDWYKDLYNETVCTNCAYTTTGSGRVLRGGEFIYDASYLLGGSRVNYAPANRRNDLGSRCARPP